MDLVALAQRIAAPATPQVPALAGMTPLGFSPKRPDIAPEPAVTVEDVAAMVATAKQDPRVEILERQLAALREQLSTAQATIVRYQAHTFATNNTHPAQHASAPRRGREPSVMLEGNAYLVRHQLKAIGCYWNPDDRCWMAPESRQEQAQAIIDNANA